MEIIDKKLLTGIEIGDLVYIDLIFDIKYYIVIADRLRQIFSLVSTSGVLAYTGYRSIGELQKDTECVLAAKNKDLKLSF